MPNIFQNEKQFFLFYSAWQVYIFPYLAVKIVFEQFNARVENENIKSYYVLVMLKCTVFYGLKGTGSTYLWRGNWIFINNSTL